MLPPAYRNCTQVALGFNHETSRALRRASRTKKHTRPRAWLLPRRPSAPHPQSRKAVAGEVAVRAERRRGRAIPKAPRQRYFSAFKAICIRRSQARRTPQYSPTRERGDDRRLTGRQPVGLRRPRVSRPLAEHPLVSWCSSPQRTTQQTDRPALHGALRARPSGARRPGGGCFADLMHRNSR
jgi:hypothetical protein